jgi:hypothetical protein
MGYGFLDTVFPCLETELAFHGTKIAFHGTRPAFLDTRSSFLYAGDGFYPKILKIRFSRHKGAKNG